MLKHKQCLALRQRITKALIRLRGGWSALSFFAYTKSGSLVSRQKYLIRIQWATLVTHHFFRAHIFRKKYWNQTFSMVIYLLTFHLFDDIEKKYRNHSCESFCYVKGNFDKNVWHVVQPERLYFLFAFCARHYPWWALWQKNNKNNYFIKVNPLFSVVKFSNTITFWRNARFDVILTSFTIIKQDFLRKLFFMSHLLTKKYQNTKTFFHWQVLYPW